MAATHLELIENRRSELQAAFLAFGSVSEQLSGAFDSLRAQVAQLRAELGEAHAGKEYLAALLTRQQRLVTLGELAAGLAHQIRTPLAAALLYASQMTLPGRSPEDLARCVREALDKPGG